MFLCVGEINIETKIKKTIKMKNNMKTMKLNKTIALVVSGACLFASCSKDPVTIDDGGNKGVLPNGATITGTITENTTLSKGNNYILKAGVHVKQGATLTIEEGVTVKSDPNEPVAAYLLIEPGAKINAVGTENAPIVFTSGKANPKTQDWGGIILTGKAPINVEGGAAASEMGAGVTYGGTNANDNSGVMKYVRVEYTGKKSNADKEHNGFTFEGVGAGTILEHLSVFKGADDGIEFFGGTVNLKYAVVYGAEDDSFDWTYGWSGKGQFWVAIQGDDYADRAIEADNNGKNNSASPFSNPMLSNLTLVGSTKAQTDDGAGSIEAGKTRAMKLREGTKGKLQNIVAYGFHSGIEVEHDQTFANMNDGSLSLTGVDIYGPKSWSYKGYTGSTKPYEETGAKNTSSTDDTPSYITDIYVGSSKTDASDPKQLDSWFDAASYRGAVESAANNWLTKGSWAKIK
jgi:hypothetical protein